MHIGLQKISMHIYDLCNHYRKLGSLPLVLPLDAFMAYYNFLKYSNPYSSIFQTRIVEED
jgi:hypothetical protein